MRKAKEYAKDILEEWAINDEASAILKSVEVIKSLFGEMEEIKKTRNIVQYESMLHVFKEQHNKWLSICRRVNEDVNILNEDGFLNVVEARFTMIYPNLMMILKQ